MAAKYQPSDSISLMTSRTFIVSIARPFRQFNGKPVYNLTTEEPKKFPVLTGSGGKDRMIDMNFWLMKSEPSVFSIEDLKRVKVSGWDGVRNYQARNFMRAMKPGDKVLFYHSNAEPSGIAGLAEVAKTAYPDPTQFDRKDVHFDPKATKEKPIWDQVDLRWVRTFERLIPLDELRRMPALKDMALFTRARLSVLPVTPAQWDAILKAA